jgi:hypothetical protein
VFCAFRSLTRCIRIRRWWRVFATSWTPLERLHVRRLVYLSFLGVRRLSRADLAEFMLRQLTTDTYVHKTPAVMY